MGFEGEKSNWQSIENVGFFSVRVVGGETSYFTNVKKQNQAVM